jgi:hypothetical protein
MASRSACSLSTFKLRDAMAASFFSWSDTSLRTLISGHNFLRDMFKCLVEAGEKSISLSPYCAFLGFPAPTCFLSASQLYTYGSKIHLSSKFATIVSVS